MRSNILGLFLALACVSCAPAEKPRETKRSRPAQPETPVVGAVSTEKPVLSSADSLQVIQLRSDFKGIAYYFVSLPTPPKCRIRFCFDERVRQLKLMMAHENRPMPQFLESYEPWSYNVDTLDIANGFLKMTCTQCENVETLAVWNKSDGTKLIGRVDRGCGPVCSDDVTFFLASADRIVEVPTDSVMPTITPKAFLADSATVLPAGEPDEIAHTLPRIGTTIVVTLPGVDSRSDTFKGNTIELVWSDGTFKIGKIYFK